MSAAPAGRAEGVREVSTAVAPFFADFLGFLSTKLSPADFAMAMEIFRDAIVAGARASSDRRVVPLATNAIN
jgi:hypothetical protein